MEIGRVAGIGRYRPVRIAAAEVSKRPPKTEPNETQPEQLQMYVLPLNLLHAISRPESI